MEPLRILDVANLLLLGEPKKLIDRDIGRPNRADLEARLDLALDNTLLERRLVHALVELEDQTDEENAVLFLDANKLTTRLLRFGHRNQHREHRTELAAVFHNNSSKVRLRRYQKTKKFSIGRRDRSYQLPPPPPPPPPPEDPPLNPEDPPPPPCDCNIA